MQNTFNFFAVLLWCICLQSNVLVSVSVLHRSVLNTRSNLLRIYSTVCYPEESKKIVRAKIIPIVSVDNVEESPINIREVPSLSNIQKLAKQTEKTVDSVSYCLYSGGYPNESIKESVYLNLWACLTHELNTMGQSNR